MRGLQLILPSPSKKERLEFEQPKGSWTASLLPALILDSRDCPRFAEKLAFVGKGS